MHATGTIPETDARLAWALRVLNGPHILDSGCREGALTIGLARAGHEVSGADQRPEAVAAARAALRREEAQVQHRTHFLVVGGPLPFADATFDSVMLGDAELPASELEEVRRVTLAAGRVAVWLPGDYDPATLDRLAAMFQLEGFEMVEGGIGLEMVSSSPLPGTVQPLVRAVEDAARTLKRAADPGHAVAGNHGEPAEIRALLASSRADRSRLDSLEAERDLQVVELRSRVAELERGLRELDAARRDLDEAAAAGSRRAEELAGRLAEAEAELAYAQARAERAEGETREAQAVARVQEHRIAEAEAAAHSLRSQLAQSAEDARRRFEARGAMQVQLDHARKDAQRLKSQLAERNALFDEHHARHATVEAELQRQLAGSRASVKVLKSTVADQRRALGLITQSRGHRFVRHVWALKRRRRVVGLKAAATAVALLACLVSLLLGWGLAGGLLAIAAVVAGGVLALELIGPFVPGAGRALKRRLGRASS